MTFNEQIKNKPISGVRKLTANRILNEIDIVFYKYWNILSSMGLSNAEFNMIKKEVKRRL